MPAEAIRPPNPSSKTTKVSARAPVAKTKQTHKVTKTGGMRTCGVDLIGCGVCAIIRDSPDDARTNMNIRTFPALRQDRAHNRHRAGEVQDRDDEPRLQH